MAYRRIVVSVCAGGQQRLALLLAVLLCGPTLAAEPDPQAATSIPEEVLIRGDRSILNLRLQLMETERRTYEVFNKFNDEARFMIECSVHSPTGTRIKRQVCTPEFQLEATRAHARDYIDGTFQALPMEAAIAGQMQEYRAKIKQVAEQHPEFLDAVIDYTEKRQAFESALSLRDKD